jgi:hypothetical protein
MRSTVPVVLTLVALGSAGALVLLLRSGENSPSGSEAQVGARDGARDSFRPVEQRVSGSSDPAATLDKIRSEQRGEMRRTAIVEFLAGLAESEPELAMQLAAALSEEEGRSEAFHECLPHWLGSAPEAARSWLLTHVQSLPAETAQALAKDAAAVDPALGFAVAQQIYVATRTPAMKEVFGSWAAQDPEAAVEAVQRLSKEDGYFAAVEEIGRIWAESDPASAYAWAAKLDRSDARRAALVPLIDTWALKDPAAAARSVSALQSEPWRRRLIDEVADRWASSDPRAALAWIQGLQDPLEREAGATTVLTQLLGTEPELSARWAVQFGGNAHNPLVDKVMTAWLARDPTAADNWLRTHPSARPTP